MAIVSEGARAASMPRCPGNGSVGIAPTGVNDRRRLVGALTRLQRGQTPPHNRSSLTRMHSRPSPSTTGHTIMVAGLSRRRFLETATVAAVAAEAFAAEPAARPAPIRIGQIGVKHGHATKLGVYRRSPDYEVVGVIESDAEARRKVEAEPAYAGLPWMTREQLLAMPELQAVLVETAVPDLLDNAEACIAAG